MDDSASGPTVGQRVAAVGPDLAPGDRELVRAILAKDRKAAAQFVSAHIDAVYAYVRRRLTPRLDLADDVVQDVFLAALHGLSAFQGHSTLRTWLIGIARHKLEDVYRQRLRLLETTDIADALDHAESAAPPVDEQMDDARAQAKAHRILARLPERYALVLLWRYWERRSAADMAAAIGTTTKSVERTLARARARFKELWLTEDRDVR